MFLGHADAGNEEKSLQAGMNAHVAKPIDPDQLFSTLVKWIKPGEKRSPDRQPEVTVADSESHISKPETDDLPESLPGFDLAAGLKRLQGNKRLYRKLLLDFQANYSEAADEIRGALADKNFDQVHSLVHNLKGLAGNLEATNLQKAAMELEGLVRGKVADAIDEVDLNRKFAGLEDALDEALDAVQIFGPTAEKKTIESDNDTKVPLPDELKKKIAENIKEAAEMGDVMQIKSIADELKSESDVMGPICDELIQLAEDFDFDGIQKFVMGIED